VTIQLSTLAVAFAAFCVWLTVRIVNRRERWAKWTLAVVVGLPVLYVASFGPACWICSRLRVRDRHVRFVAVPMAYYPVGSACFYGPLNRPFERYARWGMAQGSGILIPFVYSGIFNHYLLMSSADLPHPSITCD
jgi:hypothetical protein